MMQALGVSATGMSAQQLNMDTIANNLANVNTTAYKCARAQFADIFVQQVGVDGEANANGVASPAQGLGTRNVAILREFTQGTIETTNNPLDVAIEGDGFLQVIQPDGTLAYTREGALKVNAEGYLCNSQGFAVSPEIQIPTDASSVSIGADGTVSVTTPQDATAQPIGQLELARFINPAGLQSEGQNLMTATAASGEPIAGTPGTDGLGTLVGGSLERSNVNLVAEMVNMIQTQRAYEVNTKAIQATDEMMRMSNNLRRA